MITKEQLGIQEKLYFEAFHIACPLSLSTIKKKDKESIISDWRTAGMLWMLLCGYTSLKTGYYFNRLHSTVLKNTEEFVNRLQVKDTEATNILNQILEANKKVKTNRKPFEEELEKTNTIRNKSINQSIENILLELEKIKNLL